MIVCNCNRTQSITQYLQRYVRVLSISIILKFTSKVPWWISFVITMKKKKIKTFKQKYIINSKLTKKVINSVGSTSMKRSNQVIIVRFVFCIVSVCRWIKVSIGSKYYSNFDALILLIEMVINLDTLTMPSIVQPAYLIV